MTLFDLTNKTALITGAAQGIGRAIAESLATQGATVTVVDLNGDLATQTATALPGSALACQADVSNPEQFQAAINQTIAQFGQLDILVNNAAIINTMSIDELPLVEWERILRINLTSVFIGCQLVARPMRAQQSGRIINISSIAGKVGGGLFGTAAYATAKAGVTAFSKSLARELAPYGVTANVVAPGPIETPLTSAISDPVRQTITQAVPLGRFGHPQDIGAAVAFLAADESGFITGEVLDVNGGLLMD